MQAFAERLILIPHPFAQSLGFAKLVKAYVCRIGVRQGPVPPESGHQTAIIVIVKTQESNSTIPLVTIRRDVRTCTSQIFHART